jgi:hypothetical protein
MLIEVVVKFKTSAKDVEFLRVQRQKNKNKDL